MPNFKFNILTGLTEEACQQKYDAIVTKDPNTFYLLQSGIGYFGTTKLFGGDSKRMRIVGSNIAKAALEPNCMYFVTADITITDNTDTAKTAKTGSIWISNGTVSYPTVSEISQTVFATYLANYITNQAVQSSGIDVNYTANDSTIMTAGAVAAYVSREINAQSILEIQFLKRVAPAVVTLTSTDITNGYVTITFNDATGNGTFTKQAPVPSGSHADDVGLGFLFQVGTAYNDDTTAQGYDGDTAVFVNLHGLINNYVAGTSNTTTVTIQDKAGENHTKEVTVEVNKSTTNGLTAAQWESKILAAIDIIDAGNTYDPTDSSGDNLSDNKFITEQQFAGIMAQLLRNFVQYLSGSAEPIIDSGDENE